jgi:hypothetical protein
MMAPWAKNSAIGVFEFEGNHAGGVAAQKALAFGANSPRT